MIIDSIQAAIGHTPLLRFTHQQFEEIPTGSAIYAKLEYLNPGGSIKDRLGAYLIEEGLALGKIKKVRRLLSRQLATLESVSRLPHWARACLRFLLFQKNSVWRSRR